MHNLEGISLPNFAFFTVKSPSATQRSVSQENAFKKSKTQSPFFGAKLLAQVFLFYSNWKQCQVLKIAKSEFKVTVHYSLWVKCTVTLTPWIKFWMMQVRSYTACPNKHCAWKNRWLSQKSARLADQIFIAFWSLWSCLELVKNSRKSINANKRYHWFYKTMSFSSCTIRIL